MNIGELKKKLEQYPDDLEVLVDQHSDYAPVDDLGVKIVWAVPDSGGWVMRSHPTMSAEKKSQEKRYLLISNF